MQWARKYSIRYQRASRGIERGDIVPLAAFLGPPSPPRARSGASSRESTLRSLGIRRDSAATSRDEIEGGDVEEMDLGQDTSYRGYMEVRLD